MLLPFYTTKDLPLEDRTVLMRVDMNSPINPDTGEILSMKRIEEHARSIKKLPACKLVLLAHQSRPGKKDFTSLSAHAKALSKSLDREVRFMDGLFNSQVVDGIKDMKKGDIILLENTRFFAEDVDLDDSPIETQERTHIVKVLSKVCDFFVNDAFSAVHRSQPTLVGFCGSIPSCAGPSMENELRALVRVMEEPARPSVALLGGLKVDDSIKVGEHLLDSGIIDKLLTVGVVGSMFQWAAGYDLGIPNVNFIRSEVSDCDALLEKCKRVLEHHPSKVLYPEDMAVNKDGERVRVTLGQLPAAHPIQDIDLETIAKFSNILKEAMTIIANGPAGVFEKPEFSEGTFELFRAINDSKGYSVMGGGETNQVIKQLKLTNIGHVSTGGGALISYLTGQEMPVITALKRSKEKFPLNGLSRPQ